MGFAQVVRAFGHKCDGRVLLAIWKRVNPTDDLSLSLDQFCLLVTLMLQATAKENKSSLLEGEKEPPLDVVLKIFDTLVTRCKNVGDRVFQRSTPSILTLQTFTWDSTPFHQILEELFRILNVSGHVRHSIVLYVLTLAGVTVGSSEKIFGMVDERKEGKLNLRVCITSLVQQFFLLLLVYPNNPF